MSVRSCRSVAGLLLLVCLCAMHVSMSRAVDPNCQTQQCTEVAYTQNGVSDLRNKNCVIPDDAKDVTKAYSTVYAAPLYGLVSIGGTIVDPPTAGYYIECSGTSDCAGTGVNPKPVSGKVTEYTTNQTNKTFNTQCNGKTPSGG